MELIQGCLMSVLLVYINDCLAAVTILGEETRYFTADKPLSIECELTGSTTAIDFRFNSVTVVACEPVFGCSRLNLAYNVIQTESNSLTRYILHTVNNFTATDSGVYQCTDTVTRDSDTTTVLYRELPESNQRDNDSNGLSKINKRIIGGIIGTVLAICITCWFMKWIIVALLTLFVFIKKKKIIADNMSFEINCPEKLITLNDQCCFYVLLYGKIEVFLDDELVETITCGDGFGQFDVIYGIATNDTIMTSVKVKKDNSNTTVKVHAMVGSFVVKTSSCVILLKMTSEQYSNILMKQKKAEWQYTLYREILSECDWFKDFGQPKRQMVASNLKATCFRNDDVVWQSNKVTKYVFIIVQGTVLGCTDVDDRNTCNEPVTLHRFAFFGHGVSETFSSCIAHGPVLCAILHFKIYQDVRDGKDVRAVSVVNTIV